MFSLDVIDTDLFIDMPHSSQCLYFHLAMKADDDGFVASPKKIAKSINVSNDDFKLLIAKGFIIPFESGICVITHWRIHNYIQNDRYTRTIYQNEKEQLNTDNKGIYTCIQNVSKMDTQVRLGKVRLGKDNNITAVAVTKNNSDSVLHNKIKEIFLKEQLTNSFTNYAREGKAIKGLLKKAEEKNPDNPEIFILGMIETFRDMRQSKNAFWRDQPFTPSTLNSAGIFDRVLTEAHQRWQSNQTSGYEGGYKF